MFLYQLAYYYYYFYTFVYMTDIIQILLVIYSVFLHIIVYLGNQIFIAQLLKYPLSIA